MLLADIVKEINEALVYANEEIDEKAIDTYQGRLARKNKCKEDVRRLKRDYFSALIQSSIFILVAGQKREDFVNTAVSEHSCFTGNTETLFEQLAAKISPQLYVNKEFSSEILDIVGRHFEDKAYELGITGYPSMSYKQKYARPLKTVSDLASSIKQVVYEQVGAEVSGIDVLRSIVDVAVEKNHSAKLTAIVLPISEDQSILDLSRDLKRLSSRVAVVSTAKPSATIKDLDNVFLTKGTDSEKVGETLRTIRDSFKN